MAPTHKSMIKPLQNLHSARVCLAPSLQPMNHLNLHQPLDHSCTRPVSGYIVDTLRPFFKDWPPKENKNRRKKMVMFH